LIVDKNLEPLLVDQSASLREAMERLNNTPHLMQLVTDSDGALVGTITDGDIRRALIDGKGMEDPVHACMRRNPTVGQSVDDAIARMKDPGGRSQCVPVIDPQGRPVSVTSSIGQSQGLDTALIMAGGFGRRLGGRTKKHRSTTVCGGPTNSSPLDQ